MLLAVCVLGAAHTSELLLTYLAAADTCDKVSTTLAGGLCDGMKVDVMICGGKDLTEAELKAKVNFSSPSLPSLPCLFGLHHHSRVDTLTMSRCFHLDML